MYIYVPSMVCISRMTNLYRPSSIGRAVAPMCVLAYGGFARVATKPAQHSGWLAGCLAHAWPYR